MSRKSKISSFSIIFFILLLLLLAFPKVTQSQDKAYVRSWVPKSPTTGSLSGQPIEKVNQSTNYYDGIGRTVQVVNKAASFGTQRDIVQPIEYDEFGRNAKQFLPYVHNDGGGEFKLQALSDPSSGVGLYYYYQNPPI